MRIPNSHRQDDSRGDAMTPMIDVVFLLLIFFVCAAAGQIPESLMATSLSAPGVVETPDPLDQEPWADTVWLGISHDTRSNQIVVDMNGTTYLDLNRLKQTLQALGEVSPESHVVLDIGDSVPAGPLISVWDTCRAAGFEMISFAAESK